MTADEKRRKLAALMGETESDNRAETKIQVLFLFYKIEQFSAVEREKIADIVREEYGNIFRVEPTKIQVALFNAAGGRKASSFEVVLDISGGERVLNEGGLLEKLRKAVASRLYKFFPKWMGFTGKVGTRVGDPLPVPESKSKVDDEPPKVYAAEDAHETFERVQLPQKTVADIMRACKRIELEREVFDEWGLYAIMPNPVCALNFYGAPGTGKTLAAEALANKLSKKIIRASYADIESKFHGEGPKNVQAIFKAADEQDAVLFIDEADSLLSKRLTNVTQGSEQAINSMRSQILICLEKFHGVVIFATNLVVNYDRAFASRLTSIKFDLPDEKMREQIWRVHLLPTPNAKVKLKIPLATDIDFAALAHDYELNGRSIRNVVVNACVEARSRGMSELTRAVLVDEIERELEREKELTSAKDHTLISSVGEPLKKIAADTKTVSLSEFEAANTKQL